MRDANVRLRKILEDNGYKPETIEKIVNFYLPERSEAKRSTRRANTDSLVCGGAGLSRNLDREMGV